MMLMLVCVQPEGNNQPGGLPHSEKSKYDGLPQRKIRQYGGLPHSGMSQSEGLPQRRILRRGGPSPSGMGVVSDTMTTRNISTENGYRYRCNDWFSSSFEDNLRVIANYPRGEADRYLPYEGGTDRAPNSRVKDFPVIVTASDFKYTKLLEDFIQSVNVFIVPKYNITKVVIYDLGMYPHHIAKVKSLCELCEIRQFHFETFPNHVNRWNLKNYSWKPLVVRTTLLEFGWVWFVDASVRFTTDDLDKALRYSKVHSILFYTSGESLSIARQTDKQTFQFLKEDNCKYRALGELSSGFVLFHNDDVTNVIVDAWAACALNEECISPSGTENKLFCDDSQLSFNSNDRDGTCHRFDQSVLGILVRRLYHEQKYYPLGEESFDIYAVERVAAYELQDEDMYFYNRDKRRKATFERQKRRVERNLLL